MSAFRCVYLEVNNDRSSSNFGYLVERRKKFDTFPEAVKFSRAIANTCIKVIGKPIIEEIAE